MPPTLAAVASGLVHLLTPQSVLAAQFESTSDFGSLLRQNTPVSRMMTTYTRRGPGQSYLKNVLAERINALIEHKDLNLEINPLKVRSDRLVSRVSPQVSDAVRPRLRPSLTH